MSDEIKGIFVSPARLAYFLSALTAIGIFYSLVTYANAKAYQIDSNTARIERLEKLPENIKSLELKLTELIAVLKERDKLQIAPLTK